MAFDEELVEHKVIKALLKIRFAELCPNGSLYEIDLSHPTFCVFYKDSNGLRHIARQEHPDWNFWGEVKEYRDEGGNLESSNTEFTTSLFLGIEHEWFQGVSKKFIYKDMDYWTCPF